MWAVFSYDVIVGTASTLDVRTAILDKFATLSTGAPRPRCELLEDTFMCHIETTDDFERLNRRLADLRNQMDEQFNYAFSLNRANDPLAVRGPHDQACKNSVRTS